MIENKLQILPSEPGCYLMLNKNNDVIYVGKAKNLKNRVRSYFRGAHNEKTTLLISEISDFSYVITNSEQDSLILELNLIKEHKPKYNIKLMDDKTYPYILITDEENPTINVVRERKKNKLIFGPYPNSYSARQTVQLLNRLYTLRKCDPIPKEECLYYHMGQCLAPCINKEPIDYKDQIASIVKFLKGDIRDVVEDLETKMALASENTEYEKAREYRDLIGHIKATTEKQLITAADFKDRDFVSFVNDENDLAIQILKMREGKILDNHSVVFSYVGNAIDTATSYIQQFYENSFLPSEVLLTDEFPPEIMTSILGNKAVYPKIGDKKKMLDLATKNAVEDLTNYYKLHRHKNEQTLAGLKELEKIIDQPIDYIEVFDNANLFGTAPISALVVFKNAAFQNKMYRRYHLKTTTNDDYQAMREVTYRRYQRLLVEGKQLPDLILIDGGVGHVRVVQEVVLSLGLSIPVAGLKKDSTHTLSELVYDEVSHHLPKGSELYRLLSRFSEEVHRFAVDFHRNTRHNQSLFSPLDKVKGIGPKRKQALLKSFSSLNEIRDASYQQLRDLGLSEQIIEELKEVLK